MVLGIRTSLILIFIGFFIIVGLGSLIWIYRGKLKEWFLKWKYPNHTYRILMFYPAGRIKIFWSKVDSKNQFRIGDGVYDLDEQAIHKENKGFGTLLYFETSPNPIIPNIKNFTVELSSHELGVYKDEELISKLLMVDIGERLIRLILILQFVVLGALAYVIVNITGVMT